jgi:hypothetical protein
VKRQSFEADHSSPSSAEVKSGGAIPPLPKLLHVLTLNYADGSFDLYFHAIWFVLLPLMSRSLSGFIALSFLNEMFTSVTSYAT